MGTKCCCGMVVVAGSCYFNYSIYIYTIDCNFDFVCIYFRHFLAYHHLRCNTGTHTFHHVDFIE